MVELLYDGGNFFAVTGISKGDRYSVPGRLHQLFRDVCALHDSLPDMLLLRVLEELLQSEGRQLTTEQDQVLRSVEIWVQDFPSTNLAFNCSVYLADGGLCCIGYLLPNEGSSRSGVS